MTKIIFIFIGAFFLMLSVFSGGLELNGAQQMIICLSLIIVLGIPHGAIDNILFLKKHRVSKLKFYVYYLTTIVGNILMWLWMPLLSFLFFIGISAYHFGQSQYAHHIVKEKLSDKFLFFSWGLAVLSGLLFFNAEEISLLITTVQEFNVFGVSSYKNLVAVSFYTSLGLVFIFYILKYFSNAFKLETIFTELFTLGLIFMGFYVFPLLVGFTLYFVILHSIKVLQEEYDFVKTQRIIDSGLSFVKLLAPYTLLSIIGISLLFAAIHYEVLQISYAYCILILISSITVPHAYVMERFYKTN